MKNRLISQLLPTVIFWFIFWLSFSEYTLYDSINDHFKDGYWFTFVAVELFLLISPIFVAFTYFDISLKFRNVVLTLYIGAMTAFALIVDKLYGTDNISVWGLLSLSDLFLYLPYFYLGIMLKMNLKQISTFLTSKWVALGSLIIFIAMYNIQMNFVVHFLAAIAGILMFYYLVYRLYQFNWITESKVAKTLESIGKTTLEIYLLHYFIIYSCRFLPGLETLSLIRNTVLELPVFITVSVLIIGCCYFIVYIFKRLNIYQYLFPKFNYKVTTMSKCYD